MHDCGLLCLVTVGFLNKTTDLLLFLIAYKHQQDIEYSGP